MSSLVARAPTSSNSAFSAPDGTSARPTAAYCCTYVTAIAVTTYERTCGQPSPAVPRTVSAKAVLLPVYGGTVKQTWVCSVRSRKLPYLTSTGDSYINPPNGVDWVHCKTGTSRNKLRRFDAKLSVTFADGKPTFGFQGQGEQGSKHVNSVSLVLVGGQKKNFAIQYTQLLQMGAAPSKVLR